MRSDADLCDVTHAIAETVIMRLYDYCPALRRKLAKMHPNDYQDVVAQLCTDIKAMVEVVVRHPKETE